jgi:hypothetical protein
MKMRIAGVVLAASLAALLLPGLADSSGRRAITIEFEKDCPELTCEETASSPVGVSTVVTPVDSEGELFHYTAVETFSSPRGSVTVSLVGILKTDKKPQVTFLNGWVVRGSWDGVALAGAKVEARAIRVGDSTVFAGWVRIKPPRAG